MSQTNYEFFNWSFHQPLIPSYLNNNFWLSKLFMQKKKVLNWIQLIWEKVLQHWKLSLLTNWIYFRASGRTNVCIKVKYPSSIIEISLVPFYFWTDMAVRVVLKISALYLLQSVPFWESKYALSFYRSQNVLGRSKFFVPDQKFIYILCQSQTFCARQKMICIQ